MAWDAMLKKTGVVLELLTEDQRDIYLMGEEGISGGITMCVKRLAESGDDASLLYLDANNLYGWGMSQPLPHGNFNIQYYEEGGDATQIVVEALSNHSLLKALVGSGSGKCEKRSNGCVKRFNLYIGNNGGKVNGISLEFESSKIRNGYIKV